MFTKSFDFDDDLIVGDLGHVTLRMVRCPVILFLRSWAHMSSCNLRATSGHTRSFDMFEVVNVEYKAAV